MREGYSSQDVNNKLIWNFWDINHTMRNISEGKGSQKRILIILNEAGVMTQRELTERLGIQPGSASEVISKLENAGLISRRPSKNDGRTTDICLTDRGKAAAEEAYAQREQRHEKMFSGLTDEEKKVLLGLLERVNASWDVYYRQNEAEHRNVDYGKDCRRPSGI